MSASLVAESEEDSSDDDHGAGYGGTYHDHSGEGGTRGYGAVQNGYEVMHNGGYGASLALSSSWTDRLGRDDDARGQSR